MDNLVYVASAYAGDVRNNIEKAKRYCIHVINEGGVPLAPHLLFTQFLDDGVPAERKLGLDLALDLLGHCSELWVFGDISRGMRKEIEFAEKIGKPIRWFDENCVEWFDVNCVEITDYMRLRKCTDYLLPLAIEIIKRTRNAKLKTIQYRDPDWDQLEDDIGDFLREVHRSGIRSNQSDSNEK